MTVRDSDKDLGSHSEVILNYESQVEEMKLSVSIIQLAGRTRDVALRSVV